MKILGRIKLAKRKRLVVNLDLLGGNLAPRVDALPHAKTPLLIAPDD